MLVQNYGLYWRAADVFWGRPGKENEGTLEGVPAKNRTGTPVNFREQAGVYVLFDHLRPVYVGQTGINDQRLFDRLKTHYRRDLKGRWDTFSWFGIYPVNSVSRKLRANVKVAPGIGDVLFHIEAVLIAAMEPPLNLQRGKFGKAERFIQHRNDAVGQTQAEMTAEILRIIRELE